MATVEKPMTEVERIFHDFRAFTEPTNLPETRRMVGSTVSEVQAFAEALTAALQSEHLKHLSDVEQPQVDAELAWHLHYLAEDVQREAERLRLAAAQIDKATSGLYLSREIAVKMA
jgi:hypothetical protein